MKTDIEKTNWESSLDRIRRCKTIEEVDKLEKSFQRIYENGVYTIAEFRKLDDLLMVRAAWIETMNERNL